MTETAEIRTPWGDFRAPVRDHITKSLGSKNGHQGPERDLLVSLVRPGDTVVDVGAHIGTMSVPLGRAAQPGPLIAIEATDAMHALLRDNLELNHVDNAIAIRVLVGNDAVARAATSVAGNTGATNFREFVPTGVGVVPRGLGVVVEELLGSDATVDVVKIDVEGMEPEVLESATSFFERRRPIVMVEVHIASPHRRTHVREHLDRFFAHFEYRLLVLLGAMGRRERAAAVAELPTFRSLSKFPGTLIDVFAIPRGSERMPVIEVGRVRTTGRLTAVSARAASWSMRSLIGGGPS
jgi:FkbM family methyltransferase